MNYKETLYFTARCLTLATTNIHLEWVKQLIAEDKVDWDNVVKLSTANYVFPALYHNLKTADLLALLPKDLVEYMIHITELNKARNLAILTQAKEVNALLRTHQITPIFLKGTAGVLQGLYGDVSERMVGDIDFIVPKEDYENAYELLIRNGYDKVHHTTYDYPMFKHQPRLQHPEKIAAVEVHKELLLEAYAKEFNYEKISKNSFETNDHIRVMSYENQLALSIIAIQINDDGQYYKIMSLRNAYDVFILSQKTTTLKALEGYVKLFHPLNNFLGCCAMVFNTPESIQYSNTPESKKYLDTFNKHLEDSAYRQKQHARLKIRLFLKSRAIFMIQALYKKENAIWILRRFTDPNWWKEKWIQLGFKSAPEAH